MQQQSRALDPIRAAHVAKLEAERAGVVLGPPPEVWDAIDLLVGRLDSVEAQLAALTATHLKLVGRVG